jgi:hypothetical protein|tara:strand:+ start:1342 stop:1578 length:237 start_codon:yes stop_codon:yes gene_type:complete
MVSILNIARSYCSNWDAGNCIGCVFNRKNDKLFITLDSKLSGKSCQVERGCDFFDSVVIPGITDDKVKQSARLYRSKK